MQAGKREEAEAKKAEVAGLKEKQSELERRRDEAENAMRELLAGLPNIPADGVPVGADESANVEVRQWGEPREFDFEVKDHVDLGEALGILDLERATKIAGSRFAILNGAGARLERALVNFMLDVHTTEHGYTETLPPFIVNRQRAFRHRINCRNLRTDLFQINDDARFCSDSDRRSSGHELSRRRNSRRQGFAEILHGLHAVFSLGSRQLRARHARSDSPASI